MQKREVEAWSKDYYSGRTISEHNHARGQLLSLLDCRRLAGRYRRFGSYILGSEFFEMVISDPHRKESAFALLGQIEVWRLVHGHPVNEPRHPLIENEDPPRSRNSLQLEPKVCALFHTVCLDAILNGI